MTVLAGWVERMAADAGPLPEWSREAFRAGNTLAVTHGGFSEARVGPRAAAVLAEVMACPDLPARARSPLMARAMKRFARAQAMAELAGEWLDEVIGAGGIEAAMAPGKRGGSPLDVWMSMEGRAAWHRARVGLVPGEQGQGEASEEPGA